jgi:site-specific DNA-adenine methylase
MAQYGIPYMGSKSKIAEEICSIFPKADNFYDLFGGGFSITHCMLKKRKNDFKNFHFNEIRSGICELIQDAINGKYSYDNFKPEWISREDFLKLKETNPYVKIIWSFGNNGKTYLFGRDIEVYKKSMHQAVVFNEFNDMAKSVFGFDKFKDNFSIKDRILFLRQRVAFLNKGKPRGENERLQQLQQLRQLQQLQQLERLQRLERLNFYNMDYKDIPILPNSVIYCDPPYENTGEYDGNLNFDHDEFLNWAHKQENPVFISEYSIDDDRFTLVKKKEKRSMLNPNKEKTLIKNEMVYINQVAKAKLFGR